MPVHPSAIGCGSLPFPCYPWRHSLLLTSAESTGMPGLIRRRVNDQNTENWLIFSDGMHIGSIGIRSRVPVHIDQWQWTVAPYPVSHRGIRDGGKARSFLRRRAKRSSSRGVRSVENHRRGSSRAPSPARSHRMEIQDVERRLRGRGCFCGEDIDLSSTEGHAYTAHMEVAP